jgi:hypothetical protein
LIDQQISRALVQLVLFIELSDDATIEPDAAVAALEQLSRTLSLADPETKRTLSDQIRALSDEYPDAVEIVRGLPEGLGLEV